jgi:transposase
MNLRIQLSSLTVKALQRRLQRAYTMGDVRLVRRISVLLEVLQERQPVAALAAQWDISVACIYHWVTEFMHRRLDSLVYQRGGGRRAKLTESQKQRLCELLDEGPQAAGLSPEYGACWSSLAIQALIEQEFGVLYSRFYVCTLLRNWGYSYQKAAFVSDHFDEEGRRLWLEETWPALLAEAKRRGALILFGDEASFAQWGSLSYTWARRGQTPRVKTSGKRKAYKVGCPLGGA